MRMGQTYSGLCDCATIDHRADAVPAAVHEGIGAAVELTLELVNAEDPKDQPDEQCHADHVDE